MSSDPQIIPDTFEFMDLFDTTDLKKSVRLHLFKVYLNLTICLFSFGLGVYTYIRYGYSGAEPVVIGGLIMCCIKILHNSYSLFQYILLLCFGYCQGLSLGLVSGTVIKLTPSIFIVSFVTVSCVFLSFSISSYYTSKKQVLYLCATLISWLLIEGVLAVLNLCLRWDMLGILRPGLGLYVCMGYTIYGSQYVILSFQNNDSNSIQHALVLFIDLLSVLVRILSGISRVIRRLNEKNLSK